MILFNYAETYVEELKELSVNTLMFNLKAISRKSLNLDSYVKKHFKSCVYAVEDKDKVYFEDKDWQIVKYGDDLDVSGDICIKLPNLRNKKKEAKEFLSKLFSMRDKGKISRIMGLNISSMSIIENYNFDYVSVNPQQTARFKEVQLINSKRIDTTDWQKLVKNQAKLRVLGYTPKDLFNADYSEIVKFNIKSYLYVGEKRTKLESGTLKKTKKPKNNPIKTKKQEKYQKSPKKPFENKEKAIEASKKGVMTRKTMNLCDNCLVSEKCVDYQAGSVCSRKNQWVEIAKKFRTRDVSIIYEALTDILAKQSERYEKSVDFESMSGEAGSTEVTSLENSLFKNTSDLVKLLKPQLDTENKGNTYNITNTQINVSKGIGEIENELSNEEKRDLSGAIEGILRERKYRRARDSEMAS